MTLTNPVSYIIQANLSIQQFRINYAPNLDCLLDKYFKTNSSNPSINTGRPPPSIHTLLLLRNNLTSMELIPIRVRLGSIELQMGTNLINSKSKDRLNVEIGSGSYFRPVWSKLGDRRSDLDIGVHCDMAYPNSNCVTLTWSDSSSRSSMMIHQSPKSKLDQILSNRIIPNIFDLAGWIFFDEFHAKPSSVNFVFNEKVLKVLCKLDLYPYVLCMCVCVWV